MKFELFPLTRVSCNQGSFSVGASAETVQVSSSEEPLMDSSAFCFLFLVECLHKGLCDTKIMGPL